MRLQRIRQGARPADVLFALSGIGPLSLDRDIVLCLPLSKRRIGSADSAGGAAEELYDDAREPGVHPAAMLDDQIDDLVAQILDEGRPQIIVRAVRGHLTGKLLHPQTRYRLNRVEH